MWKIFSLRKTETKQETDLPQAIVKNKEAIATLEKRQAHLECRIAVQEEDAKARARAGDKRGALFALKRKKMFEKELEQLGNAHLTLEQQIITLESAQAQQVAVGALAAGVTAQKILNQKLNLSKIDDLIEDMQEQSNLQNELAQVLSQGNPLCEDAELLNELHELEARQLEETLADISSVPSASPGKSLMTKKNKENQTTLPSVNKNATQKSSFVARNSLDGTYPSYGHVETTAKDELSTKEELQEEEQLQKLLQDLSG